MAPTAPKKRPSIRAKSSTSSSKPTTSKPNSGSGLMSRPHPRVTAATISDNFVNSKKDKLRIKHSAFVSRIEKVSGRVGKKALKRRRPGRKLVTDLGGLGDVLGEIGDTLNLESGSGGAGGMGGSGRGNKGKEGSGGKIEMKSAKSRPGAMKKKEKMERAERERFAKNMAVLIGVGAQAQAQAQATGEKQGAGGDVGMDVDAEEGKESKNATANGTASRWAALRGFIEQTMEQKEEFRKS